MDRLYLLFILTITLANFNFLYSQSSSNRLSAEVGVIGAHFDNGPSEFGGGLFVAPKLRLSSQLELGLRWESLLWNRYSSFEDQSREFINDNNVDLGSRSLHQLQMTSNYYVGEGTIRPFFGLRAGMAISDKLNSIGLTPTQIQLGDESVNIRSSITPVIGIEKGRFRAALYRSFTNGQGEDFYGLEGSWRLGGPN